MSRKSVSFCLGASVFAALAFLAFASTEQLEVQTLRDMYIALNSPLQLRSWTLKDGDPCVDLWVGISCSGSSVIHIKLRGFNLTGTLDFEIANLQQLTELDLSSNNIHGEIPHDLPLNLTHVTLACNQFSQKIPDSLSSLKNLRTLNLSHNILSGPLGDFLSGMTNMREMDLSYNNLSGDLPSSFGALTNLTALFLQNNSLTGSVSLLADLPLKNLNIEDNHFSGVIPEKFQGIRNLWLGGNRFSITGNSPPWSFPPTNELSISPSPQPSPNCEKRRKRRRCKKKKLSKGEIAGIVVGSIVGGGILVGAVEYVRRKLMQEDIAEIIPDQLNFELPLVEGILIDDPEAIPLHFDEGIPIDNPEAIPQQAQLVFPLELEQDPELELPSVAIPQQSPMGCPSELEPRPELELPPFLTHPVERPRRSVASKKSKIPICAKLYSMAELESATNCFSKENLMTEGPFSSIYKAEFPDGQLLIVKCIKMALLSLHEEQFLDAIRPASLLRHPNIITLIGYSIELGHFFLVYEYVRNMSLDDALHNAERLTWKLRLRVAVGVARALNYMHSSSVPPIAHNNLTASNIFLDEDFRPRISDCGLANLQRLIKSRSKLKAPVTASAYSSYDLQESNGNTKDDVYDFGVLLLQLLTGKLPFDSSRPKDEESLVQWSMPRLHDNKSLEEMVDPQIRNKVPLKTISHFADIILLCLQAEVYRAPMSEVVEALMRLVQKNASSVKVVEKGGDLADPFDRSFRSTSTHFVTSPTLSYYSI